MDDLSVDDLSVNDLYVDDLSVCQMCVLIARVIFITAGEAVDDLDDLSAGDRAIWLTRVTTIGRGVVF